MTIEINDHFARILHAPVFAFLGTTRPNGEVQINPMWFEFDADSQTIRFTHTTKRAKFRNLQQNPSMTLAMTDPENAHKYVEVRGTLSEVIPDPEGDFYVRLGKRYGDPETESPDDRADRVILVMQLEKVNGR